MKIIQGDQIKATKRIGYSDNSITYMTESGSVLKVFQPIVHLFYEAAGTSLANKITSARPIKNVPEIVVPTAAVYNGRTFIGYLTDFVSGQNYNEFDNNLSLQDRVDLNMYANMHHKLEDIVKRGNKEGIIFPDLCSCDNIIITRDGNMKIIDYDGLQVKQHRSICLSSSLGNQEQYMTPKYGKNFLFNPNLDKKSLMNLYFLSTFNINLETIGLYNPYTRRTVTVDEIFNTIGLEDDTIKHKVWKCFQPDQENDFLGDDVYRVAEQYKMSIMPQTIGGAYLKKLRKK